MSEAILFVIVLLVGVIGYLRELRLMRLIENLSLQLMANSVSEYQAVVGKGEPNEINQAERGNPDVIAIETYADIPDLDGALK